MAEHINSYCTVCGKGYHLCMSCNNHKFTPWRSVTDTSEHYKIHQVLSAYNCGKYTKDEAKARLANVDLSDVETFRENVKNQIREIMADDVTDSDVKNKQIDSEVKPKKSARRKKLTVETE